MPFLLLHPTLRCDTELYANGVEASKGWDLIVHSFNLPDSTMSLSCRYWRSKTPWSESANLPGGTYCQALLFWWHTNFASEMWCIEAKFANQVPTNNVKTQARSESLLLWLTRAPACFSSWPKLADSVTGDCQKCLIRITPSIYFEITKICIKMAK